MTSDACQAADDDVNKCGRLATRGRLIAAAAAAAPSSSATRPPPPSASAAGSARQQHERRARSVAGDHWPASHVSCRRHCVAIGQQQQQQQHYTSSSSLPHHFKIEFSLLPSRRHAHRLYRDVATL